MSNSGQTGWGHIWTKKVQWPLILFEPSFVFPLGGVNVCVRVKDKVKVMCVPNKSANFSDFVFYLPWKSKIAQGVGQARVKKE